MTEKIRAGVIGCGAIAQACHLPGYAKNQEVELVAVADISQGRLNEADKLFGVKNQYTDYRKMLEKEELDAVSICGPNSLRVEMVTAVAGKGIHILCEKPMCLTLEGTEKIKAVIERNKVKMMVGFTHRLFKGNIRAKKIIEKGEIGHPFMIRIRFAHMGPEINWAKSDWFFSPAEAGGGALLDMGIHAFDLCKYFMGSISRISAHVDALVKNIEVDDNAVMVFDFDNRAMGYIEVGWTSPAGFIGTEIYGTEGTVIIDYLEGVYLIRGKPNAAGETKFEKEKILANPVEGGWDIEIDHFIKGLKGDKDFNEMNWQDGYDSLKIALAAYESARKGKRIDII